MRIADSVVVLFAILFLAFSVVACGNDDDGAPDDKAGDGTTPIVSFQGNDDGAATDDDDSDDDDLPVCDFTAVDHFLDFYAASYPNRGAGLIVTNADGFLYERYVGLFTKETVSLLASSSKMPATTAFLTLVDDGLVDLDDPVSDYIDFWPEDKQAVTIRHLLTHTSALPSISPCLTNPNTTLEQCARSISELPLLGEPGKTFVYGGHGLQLAAYITTQVTGLTWQEFFAQRLANPMGLTTFSFGNTANPLVASIAVCNTADYARIVQMHVADGNYRGTQILSKSMVREMQANQVAEATHAYLYGLGWWLMREGLIGPINYCTDQGGTGTNPWLDMNREYGAYLMLFDAYDNGWNSFLVLRKLVADSLTTCY